MNKIKLALLFIAITYMSVNATFAGNIDTLIKKSELNKTSTIAVSVKDAKTGKTVYEYNEHKLMNPASVQKIFTMKSAYEQLGEDYIFKTAAYTDKSDNLYIKLSADPSLTTAKLKTLLKKVVEKHPKPFNDIIVDGSVIDNIQWGTGWMWDDDTNSLLPKISPFSINENKIDITIESGKNGMPPVVKSKSGYQMQIVNLTKNGNSNNITFERTPWETGDMTYIRGTIKTPIKIQMPVDSVHRYFYGELSKATNQAQLKYKGTYKTAPLPAGLNKISEISSEPMSELTAYTLKNSNNFYSEMIFKAASANLTNSQGSTSKAIDMFEKYFAGIKSDKPIIVDACGISRNDLMSADWVTESLNKIYNEANFEKFNQLLAKPIEGTLSDRLLEISLNLRAKTGTASGISSIAGYIDTKSGKKYSFAIMIQNHNTKMLDVKKFEDSLIREIYKM